jgi:PAS domain S-box-containing protein
MSSRSRPTPTLSEARFNPEELFFSTTDTHGRITSGNDVFARISGYSGEELMGSPHSIIRHPDMPRAVFKVFWDHLEAGRPVAAYVKNMAADGSFYWVLALACPIDGGYVSVRLKPSGRLFPVVAALYAELHQLEFNVESAGGGKKAAIDDAAAALAVALKKHGYHSYDELMHTLLVDEVRQRAKLISNSEVQSRTLPVSRRNDVAAKRTECRSLRREVSRLFAAVSSFLDLDEALVAQAVFTTGLGRDVQMLSINAQVRAAGLADAGRTLQVIAEHMNRSAFIISSAATDVSQYLRNVSLQLRETAFNVAALELAVEMMDIFLGEIDASDATDITTACRSVAQLGDASGQFLGVALKSIAAVAGIVRGLDDRLEDFLRQVRVLEILHVTGKTEAVRQPESSSVASIFEAIRERAFEARQKLSDLATMVGSARIRAPSGRAMSDSLAVLTAA